MAEIQASNGKYLKPRHLQSSDDFSSFSCSLSSVDAWAREKAQLWHQENHATVWVLPYRNPHSGVDEVAGFYTLSSLSIQRNKLLPKPLRKHGTPAHIPATLIGQFAVSNAHKGQGLGRALLGNALENFLRGSHFISSKLLIVNADGENAADWWRKYGFQSLKEENIERLYLTYHEIKNEISRCH